VLSTSRPALPADYSALNASRCASYGSLHAWHLALAPVKDYSLLDTWRLAVSRERLRNPHLASCVELELLRVQHLVLPDGASDKFVQIHVVKPLELTFGVKGSHLHYRYLCRQGLFSDVHVSSQLRFIHERMLSYHANLKDVHPLLRYTVLAPLYCRHGTA